MTTRNSQIDTSSPYLNAPDQAGAGNPTEKVKAFRRLYNSSEYGALRLQDASHYTTNGLRLPRNTELESDFGEGFEKDGQPRIPRDSLVVSDTLSDKKQRKDSNFSFNAKIEEFMTLGNIQTTAESECKVTPRLVTMSQPNVTELRNMLTPNERLDTVEEVGTPSREVSTNSDLNNIKSFYSRKSGVNNQYNNSGRVGTSEVTQSTTIFL